MPNTPIVGDPHYRVTGSKTLAIEQHDHSWQTLTKCTTNTNPVLEYSTMPTDPSAATPPSPVAAPQSPPYRNEPAPTLPFLDWNACPFEGCTYGKWTAASAVKIFDTWKDGRKQIATLPAQAVVTGISGVVITYKPGVIRLNADLPEDGLRRGDTILTYTYRGEGFSAVWFKGKFYSDYDISFTKWPDGTGCNGNHCAGTYVDLGNKIWWAKVRASSGMIGWVNMNEANFTGVDSLADLRPFWPCPIRV